jgi:hypothetical protein
MSCTSSKLMSGTDIKYIQRHENSETFWDMTITRYAVWIYNGFRMQIQALRVGY